jgi:hypothetical protein
LAVSAALASGQALAANREGVRQVVKPATPNNLTIGSTLVRDFAGTDLVYRRHLGWRVTAGAALEYLFAHPGFDYLQGAAERVELTLWASRVFHGPFFSAHAVASQQFLARDSSVRSLALGGGADVGWNWMLGFGLNVGFSAGVRRSKVLRETSLICTRDDECPFVRQDFTPRFALQISYAF